MYALVTGSSSGIGRALAYEFARQKINVILIALPDSGLKKVRDDLIITYGVRSDLLEIDLTLPGSQQANFNWCQSNAYDVGILVNNAGLGNFCAFENMERELITRMLILNNYALVGLTHLFASHLKSRHGAYVLNVGSLGSFFPLPNKSVYAATKSFVHAFSTGLRLEWKQFDVHVCCLCPGSTITNAEVADRVKAMSSNYRSFHQTPESVAKEAVRALFQKKKTIVPGWPNKLFYQLAITLPSFVIDWFLLRLFGRTQTKNTVLMTHQRGLQPKHAT